MRGHTEKLESLNLGPEPGTPKLQHLGKYEVHEKIGEGGFGVVFRGFDPFIKRSVAIKTCTSPDQNIRERYFREAEIAGKLDHQHIVRIFDFGIENDTPFLVQEFLGGGDLDHKIGGNEFVPYPERLLYLLHIARGLQYAHSQGVIHRDVKPANIRILDDGSAKIMDFGVAMLQNSDHRLTEIGMTVGTAAYLAPEQIQGQPTDPRTDIFAFGILAYELLCGQRPFDRDNISATLYAILHDDPKPLNIPDSQCPAPMRQLILDCLEKNPEGRPDDFATVLRRLEAVRRGLKMRTGSRDFKSELRRVSPGGQSTSSGSSLDGSAGSATFDPPLQREWTPRSTPTANRTKRGLGSAVIAATFGLMAGYAILANQGIVDPPAWLWPLSPREAFETEGAPAVVAATDLAIANKGPIQSVQTTADLVGEQESRPETTALTSESEVAEAETPILEPAVESLSADSSEEATTSTPVLEDATIFLQRAWHDQMTVAIDNGKALRLSTARSLKLEPGEHSFTFSLMTPEYRSIQTVQIELETGQERSLKSPIAKPGTLTVQASLGSPQGTLQIANKSVGASPLRSLQLRPGRHTLKISSPIDPMVPLSEATVDIRSSRETVVTFDLTGERDLSVRYRELDP